MSETIAEIFLDYRNVGTFVGAASKYAYRDNLRKRIDECLEAAKRSTNRYFVLDGEIVRAAQSTREGALKYMTNSTVLLSIHGCGKATHVIGTNGGTMPCGANLTQFGKTEPYYCGACSE